MSLRWCGEVTMKKLRELIRVPSRDSVANLFGVMRRRVWGSGESVHIELPALEGEEYADFVGAVREEVEEIPGVRWAVPNGVTGRLVVNFDEARVGVSALVGAVEDVERRFGIGEGSFCEDRGAHPGDEEPMVRIAVQVAADVVGAGLGVTMKLFRRSPGQGGVDLAALTSVVDNVPHLRKSLSKRFGVAPTEMGLGVFNPLIQGVGSGPISPLVDLGLQYAKLREAVARRDVWNEREKDLCSGPGRAEAPKPYRKERPVPLPPGAIEAYADDAWNMSLGGFIVGLADTQDFQSAITPLLDALPKPARFGREAFTSGVTVALADRGVLVMNPTALRRLDRVDCVILDDQLLATDRWTLDQIVTAPGVKPVKAFRKAEDLFDEEDPLGTAIDGPWQLSEVDVESLSEEWRKRKATIRGRRPVLGLKKGGVLQALMSMRMVTDPDSEELVAAIRRVGLELIISTEDPEEAATFQPDRVTGTGEELKRFIRHLQRDFQVLAYFGDGRQPAMDVADVSMGFMVHHWEVPWNADIIAGKSLQDATFLIEAVRSAKKVSQGSAALAGAGAGLGALTALRGLEKAQPGRVMTAVNGASVLALGYGGLKAARLKKRGPIKAKEIVPWHRMSIPKVLKKLGTTEEGLSHAVVAMRRVMPEAAPPGWQRFGEAVVQELQNPLTPVLAAGAAVSATVGSVVDAGIVGSVIAFNGVVGGVERLNAEAAIERMARRDVEMVRVVRGGEVGEVREDELVVGDILELEAGEVVPADCRILEAHRLEVDESSLTGESLPVRKSAEPSFSGLLTERTSMLYEGTALATGSARAAVVAVGKDVEARRVYSRSRHKRDNVNGVEARLAHLTELSLPFAGVSGGILMGLGVLRRRKLPTLVGPAVNLAVGAVPEGLPLLATTAQLSASRRLSERKVLVNNPRSMETLGRLDVLCVDKTGTLTQGKLRLCGVHDGESRGDGERGISTGHEEAMQAALRATPAVGGQALRHATDRGVVKGAEAFGVGCGDWERVRELPFKPELAFHAVLGREGGRLRVAVKGSPEAVLERCSGYRHQGRWKRMSETRRQELFGLMEELAGEGMRILAVAQRRHDGGEDELEPEHIQGLTFYGFVLLKDPLRKTTAAAVKALKRAGVLVIMVTGDHQATAWSIAKEAGLSGGDVLVGREIEELDDEGLAQRLEGISVVARATPAQKVRIVEVLQARGRVVGMTGDGANDAAAIRLADVGIALGDDSSSAARDAADLVVTDARLETIVDAVVEGRAMWRSVRDAVAILIGGNLGEVGFMLGSGVLSAEPALNSRQLLLVNLLTDVAPALAIAQRPPPEVSPEELLNEGPLESLGAPLERAIMERAVLTGASALVAWWIAQRTFQKSRASTVGLLTVIVTQLGQTVTAGKPSPAVWAAVLGTLAVVLAIIETPGVSHLLGCRPLGPVGLTTAFGAAGTAMAISALLPYVPRARRMLEEALQKSPVDGAVQEHLERFFDALESVSGEEVGGE